MNDQKTEKKIKDHIQLIKLYMKQSDSAVRKCQAVGNLRQTGAGQQSHPVFFNRPAVPIALHQEGAHGYRREKSNINHYFRHWRLHEYDADMIDQHCKCCNILDRIPGHKKPFIKCSITVAFVQPKRL